MSKSYCSQLINGCAACRPITPNFIKRPSSFEVDVASFKLQMEMYISAIVVKCPSLYN